MALPSFMTLKGEKQGDIKGSCTLKGREDTILVQAFKHEVKIPTDIQTGLSTGKRMHMPFKVVKEFDKSSPLIYTALCTGEHMKSVTLKFYRIAAKGTEEHYFTITLEDAVVVSVVPSKPSCLDKAVSAYPDMEEVSFTYRKIAWRHEVDKTEGQDDWMVPIE